MTDQEPHYINMVIGYWRKFPHLRFGQFIVNILPDNLKSDPFYVTDRELAVLAQAYAEKHSGRQDRVVKEDDEG
jgi:hypothetical protein